MIHVNIIFWKRETTLIIHSFSHSRKTTSTYYVKGPKDMELNTRDKVRNFTRQIFYWKRLRSITDCVMVALFGWLSSESLYKVYLGLVS